MQELRLDSFAIYRHLLRLLQFGVARGWRDRVDARLGWQSLRHRRLRDLLDRLRGAPTSRQYERALVLDVNINLRRRIHLLEALLHQGVVLLLLLSFLLEIELQFLRVGTVSVAQVEDSFSNRCTIVVTSLLIRYQVRSESVQIYVLSPLVWLVSFLFLIWNDISLAESQPIVWRANRHGREFKIGVPAEGLLLLMLFLCQRGRQCGGVLDRVKFLALRVRAFRLFKVRNDSFIAFFDDWSVV